MIRKDGKVYEAVIEALKDRGIKTEDVAVASLAPGSEHMILLNGEIIGEYNHINRRIFLYENIIRKE